MNRLITTCFAILLCMANIFAKGLHARADYNVIPLPETITILKDSPGFVPDRNTTITYPKGDLLQKRNAQFLQQYLRQLTGLDLKISDKVSKSNAIRLHAADSGNKSEAYRITVSRRGIDIFGDSPAGTFYAIQTLRKSIQPDCGSVEFPAATISDKPRFAYRGAHFDVVRHFFPTDSVKSFIDMLALHNINRLHWHLSDDQGWRVEIKSRPELIKYGSSRPGSRIAHTARFDSIPVEGHFTQEEIKDIIKYAADRHITIIPEIDLPGHMQSALTAYPDLGCTGGPYEVWKDWGVSEEVLCAGNDDTYRFIDDVLREIASLFPSEYIHVGGDECPKIRWEECPKCQEKIRKLGISADETGSAEEKLQSYVMHHASDFLASLGKKMIGWDETLEGGLAPGAVVMSWRGEKGGIEAAKKGHDVIMTPNDYMYFDYYQTYNYPGRPVGIGGYVPLEKVYFYNPVTDIYTPEEGAHILGVQANLWTEYITSMQHVRYMELPRMAALCEVQWSNQPKDYDAFLSRLPKMISHYDNNGYNYCRKTLENQAVFDTDLLIVGGGASGVAAGLQAARMGTPTMIVEETPWLGGMLTAAGVSAVDGNYMMPAGIFGELRQNLADHYGGNDALKTGWVSNVMFEPHVGDSILKAMTAREENLTVKYGAELLGVRRMDSQPGWRVRFFSGEGSEFSVRCKMLIDATELGDVARMAGVGYDVGMDSREMSGECIAPDSAVNIVQDITMVAILKDYGTPVVMERPENYDPMEFAHTCRTGLTDDPASPGRNFAPADMMGYGKLPNHKYMINWPINGNDIYLNLVEMTPGERKRALEKAKAKTMRYLYFLNNQLGLNTLGLADDEFPTTDLLPMMPYHRESRRIHGLVRFTIDDLARPYESSRPLYRTAIAVGDYPVDHHHNCYDGKDSLPDIKFYPVPSYGLPLGTLIPREADNMIVAEKSISVSNIVNGTTRLQPVVMQIGQAAGALASIALKGDMAPADAGVRDVQRAILDAGGYIMPFLDVEKSDSRFAPYQRIGATGILKGEGRNVGWSNQTWLRADDPLLESELDGFYEFYGLTPGNAGSSNKITVGQAVDLVAAQKSIGADKCLDALRMWGLKKSPGDVITRGEFAILVDTVLNPFDREVDINGNFK